MQREFFRKLVVLLSILVLTTSVWADDEAEASREATLKTLSEDLIYSVDRVPQRPFDTPRAVQIITSEDLQRKNGISLADILLEEAGVFTTTPHAGGGSAIVRGLSGRQVLILVDGVKINNSIWRSASRSKEQLNLIDPSSIERIEIVRGVVSVLGTEALGGVVNIITRRGPDADKPFGGTIGMRYASADGSIAVPIQFFGQTEKFRYTIGGNYFKAGNLRAGGDEGLQTFTDYKSDAAHLSVDYFATAEKTFSVALGTFQQQDVKRDPDDYRDGEVLRDLLTPIEMKTARLAYTDLTARAWAQSFRAVAYWNEQTDGRDQIDADDLDRDIDFNGDTMYGLNLELGTFLGSHHVLYGVDYSSERIESWGKDFDEGATTPEISRGRYMDGAQYRTLGIYLNDRFDVGRWLTLSGGARYGQFSTSGSETLPVIGEYNINSTKNALTTSASAIVHITPQLNLIGNCIRGFRAPTIEDMTQANIGNRRIELPAPDLEAERVNSIEAGVKYESGWFSGSAFYFRNSYTGLIEDGIGYISGLPFIDRNGNGKDDGRSEQDLETHVNFGTAKISGLEADFRVRPMRSLLVWGNFAKLNGVNEDNEDAIGLIQPKFAAAGVRFMMGGRFAPWTELSGRYASKVELGRRDIDAFRVLNFRVGAKLTDRVAATVAVENLTNAQYRLLSTSVGNSIFAPGRQLVAGAQYRF